jgi:CheY-like chemotaxis protein
MSASVLIVDDNDLIRELLTDVLQGAGYGTAEAGDRQQALDHLHDHVVMPDLIQLNLMMPRTDG